MGKTINQTLQRKLGLFSVTNIVIANMIGTGIFTTSGLLMEDLGDPLLMVVLWGAGGLIALAGALCYGELGAAIPKAGGEYAFLTEFYHPMLGFLSGWVSFIAGFSAPIAAASIGFSEYFYRAFPGLFLNPFFGIKPTKDLFSIFIIIAFTLIHLRGIAFGSKVQNYLTLLKIALMAGLILLGFSIGNGSFSHFQLGEESTLSLSTFKSGSIALMWIMFAYSGWNASTYIGSEIKNPRKNLFLSLFIGTMVVMVLYVLINLLFVFALRPEEMKGIISIGGLAINHLFGASTDRFFSLMIAIALFSSISAFIILGPRIYYAMASDGYFFEFAAKVNPKTQAPTYSILFQAVVSVIIILSGTLDQILTYIGFSLGIFPILVVLALFKLRKSGKSEIKLPGYPLTAIFYLLCAVSILVLAYIERPLESSVAIIVILCGIPLYGFFSSRIHKKSE